MRLFDGNKGARCASVSKFHITHTQARVKQLSIRSERLKFTTDQMTVLFKRIQRSVFCVALSAFCKL